MMPLIVTSYLGPCFHCEPRPGFLSQKCVASDPHQSPIWFKASLPLLPAVPLAHLSPGNSSVPCRLQLVCRRSSGFYNQPRDGCRHRRINNRNKRWVQAVSNQTKWLFTSPKTGSLLHPNGSLKQFFWTEGDLVPHHVVRRLCQLVGQSLCGQCPIAL